MAVMNIEQVSADMPLSPLFIIHGEEDLLRIEALDTLRAAAKKQGYLNREVFTADNGADWDELLQSAGSAGLFADLKLLEIHIPNGKPGKNGGDALQTFAEHLPEDTVSLILLGIAKKWWLAGMLAENWVSPVFENPAQFDGWGVLGGVYGYTFQLFLDFSGYSDLVIGMAMLLGFRLPKNFSAPLRAANIRAFWDKWHISLSTWIRDYIYIPLGGSKKGFLRTQLNLMAAMVLSGIWHGYGWNFLIWGALHGTALVLLNTGDRYFGRDALCRLKYLAPLSWLITFHFVCLTFVVFNTANPDDAGAVFSALFANANGWNAPQQADMLLLASFASVMLLYPYLQRAFDGIVGGLEKIPMWLWFIPVSAVLLLIIVLAPSGIPDFIYANF